MANLNLKGLWIPIEILTDKNLSDKEKTILSIILFLSKENNNCFCTNGTISELLNISSKQVSKLINSLKAKGYIGVPFFNIFYSISIMKSLIYGTFYTHNLYLHNFCTKDKNRM